MRRFLIPIVVLALTLGIATVGMAKVEGTPHDVNIMRGATGLEICAMCHTPHSGSGAYPLWNRTQVAQTYTMYDSPTFDMILTTGDLQAPSTHCMNCHNGVASQLVNYPGPRSDPNVDYEFSASDLTTTWTGLATPMTDDHPVSFTYDPAVDEDGNGFPAIVIGPGGTRQFVGTAVANYPLFGDTGDQVECSTCHSVHHTVSGYGEAMSGTGPGPGLSSGTQVYFLRGPNGNANSEMCRSCHTLR